MLRKLVFISLIAGIVVLGHSCKNYSKILKSGNNELKYETGIDLYEKGDFNRALQFFDLLRAVNRGTEKGEKLTYYTADCYYQMKDYQIASYYYKQYAQMYPRGEYAEDAAYLSAYCNYLESPRPSLDQTNTYLALKELQTYIDLYPQSPRIDDAHILMDDLREKLEIKAYNVGMLYYKMGDYQASITSFESLLDEYPDTDFKESILYSITKAYFTYAENSIYSKKSERYEKTIESYNNLLFLFPDSGYLDEVMIIKDKAHENIEN
ncbi:MAG: outer membrane protein assembly factor BamD [Bacteroidetes bacterium]|jgi:outer membrane protein assembly factor BamD|nr:outer membrane protein assembly factor BamD [Bacteroidota bacterium]